MYVNGAEKNTDAKTSRLPPRQIPERHLRSSLRRFQCKGDFTPSERKIRVKYPDIGHAKSRRGAVAVTRQGQDGPEKSFSLRHLNGPAGSGKIYVVHGIETSIDLHKRILTHPAFLKGETYTNFIELYEDDLLGAKRRRRFYTHRRQGGVPDAGEYHRRQSTTATTLIFATNRLCHCRTAVCVVYCTENNMHTERPSDDSIVSRFPPPLTRDTTKNLA